MEAVERVRALSGGRGLGHAYLLEGERAARRGELARLIACALVCAAPGDRPCLTCTPCRKTLAGIHPDVITVAPEPGKELSVGQIRALRSDAYIRPNESARKVYWIADAHRMNPSAQNALLKVLEEGPRYAAFLLETPSSALLLRTVASRCECLRAAPDGAPDAPDEAAQLAALLRGGDEAALAEFCAALEKRKRDELSAILDGAAELLLRAPPREALPCIRALRRCRAACERNVGTGHITGYLAAAVFCR